MSARAAPPIFPYPDHRTMAVVMAEEERKRVGWRERYKTERTSGRASKRRKVG